jgi:hypothetical protein
MHQLVKAAHNNASANCKVLYYKCVIILQYTCPNSPTYLSSYYCMCHHTPMCVLTLLYMCNALANSKKQAITQSTLSSLGKWRGKGSTIDICI